MMKRLALSTLYLRIVAGHAKENLLEVGPALGEIGTRAQLLEGAVRDLLPAVHDNDARADFLDEVQQMRRQQYRRAVASARHDRLAHAADAERVESGQR